MLDLNKEYNFRFSEYGINYEFSFTSTPKEAFQLASNYEANLYLDDKMVLCPLGSYYEENNALTVEHLGIELKNLGYKHKDHSAFKNIVMRKYSRDFSGNYEEIPVTTMWQD